MKKFKNFPMHLLKTEILSLTYTLSYLDEFKKHIYLNTPEVENILLNKNSKFILTTASTVLKFSLIFLGLYIYIYELVSSNF